MIDHVPEGRYGGDAAREEHDQACDAIVHVQLGIFHVEGEEKPTQVDEHCGGLAR